MFNPLEMVISDLKNNYYIFTDTHTALTDFLCQYEKKTGQKWCEEKRTQLGGQERRRQCITCVVNDEPMPLFINEIIEEIKSRIIKRFKNKPRRRVLKKLPVLDAKIEYDMHRIETMYMFLDITAIVWKNKMDRDRSDERIRREKEECESFYKMVTKSISSLETDIKNRLIFMV